MTVNPLDLKHKIGNGRSFGAIKAPNGIMFTCAFETCKSIYLLIYDNSHNLIDRIDMSKYKINSSVSSCLVEGLQLNDFTYIYEVDGIKCPDKFAKNFKSNRKYKDKNYEAIEGRAYNSEFDWEGDIHPSLKYSDVIAYQLHVRGFSAHYSSKVTNKGTFLGIVEKINYFNELGINQIVLMPAYEFEEIDRNDINKALNYLDYKTVKNDLNEVKLNYWGFKEGYYYSPKTSYAVNDAVTEFKYMVKMLHKANIEIIMRFYFPDDYNKSFIGDILRFWVYEYHVDGFFLMGNNIPIDILASDLLLKDCKLYNVFFNKEGIINRNISYNPNMAYVNNDFSIVCRKYLKSDEDMLHNFLYRQKLNPSDVHVVNYITDYEGFTLNDLVSYDYKHNDENGEDNKDGENYNYSWNCGVEGFTRKKSVNRLRISQIKNALVFLLFAQGTPMLLAGDEFLNTQNGNNNPYCQDNETGWLVWKDSKTSKEIYEFVKNLIELRKNHPILHPEHEFRIMDYASHNYPDLSYHGENAWAPKFDNHLRNIGIMLCGKYAKINPLKEDDFFYIAYNMHWQEHNFGLPRLPKGLKWCKLLTTFDGDSTEKINVYDDSTESILVPGRYITVLKSEPCEVQVSEIEKLREIEPKVGNESNNDTKK